MCGPAPRSPPTSRPLGPHTCRQPGGWIEIPAPPVYPDGDAGGPLLVIRPSRCVLLSDTMDFWQMVLRKTVEGNGPEEAGLNLESCSASTPGRSRACTTRTWRSTPGPAPSPPSSPRGSSWSRRSLPGSTPVTAASSTSWPPSPRPLGPGQTTRSHNINKETATPDANASNMINSLPHHFTKPNVIQQHPLRLPLSRHLYEVGADPSGQPMKCITCELPTSRGEICQVPHHILTFVFCIIFFYPAILIILSSPFLSICSCTPFCPAMPVQRNSIEPNWSFSHYIHTCLGQGLPEVGPFVCLSFCPWLSFGEAIFWCTIRWP